MSDPPYKGIPEDEAGPQFDRLQAGLALQWKLIGGRSSHEFQELVVVPSVSLELQVPPSVLQMYEERMLFLLLLLRKPGVHITYLTSMPVRAEIVDYYLGLLPGVIHAHARRRLRLMAVQDATDRPLTRKILDRPRLIDRVRRRLLKPEATHLVPYTTSVLERDLAIRLGIPMFGADPRVAHLGSKSGGRRIFRDEGVAVPLGAEDLATVEECVEALASLRRERPDLERAVVKLNDGVSGEGNAEVDLTGLPQSGSSGETAALRERFESMRFDLPTMTLERFMEEMADRRGVVEERLRGDEIRSPSAQARITPLGEVQILSTHDQLLGGASGQSYLGARFPADPAYSARIAADTGKVGERLAREGVVGRFAVDFVAVKNDAGDWNCSAIEINLRKGGTTAPYLILEYLVRGEYDWQQSHYVAPDGDHKYYVGDDHVEIPALKGMYLEDIFDVVVRADLHYDHARQTGVVFHMMSAVTEQGRMGLTAIADSPEAAEDLWRRTCELLQQEAERPIGADAARTTWSR